MRWVFVLVLLAGCNEVLGLSKTRYDEIPVDAPFHCPADRPLRFATELQLVHAQPCIEYSRAAGVDLGVAVCIDPIMGARIAEARDGGPLAPAQGIQYDSITGDDVYGAPRATPDGQGLFVRGNGYDGSLGVLATHYDEYVRAGAGWSRVGRLAFAMQPGDWLSSIARDPGGERVLLLRGVAMEEWIRTAGQPWTRSHTYAPGALGRVLLTSAMLSRDGLQLVVVARDGAMTKEVTYASRPTVDVPFGMLVALPDLPVPADDTIYFTANCERAYLSGLDAIFYTQQQ